MKKRLLCMALMLIMIVSALLLVGCSKDDETSADMSSDGAKTITMWVVSEQKVSADTNFDREFKDTILPRANRMNKYYTKVFGLVLRKSTFYNLLICLVTVAFILAMMAIFG